MTQVGDVENDQSARPPFPAPRGVADTSSAGADTRIAEVLRALQRAKGTLSTAGSGAATSEADRANEILALRGFLLSCSPSMRDAEQTVISRARVLEGALAVATRRLTDFERGQDRVVRELRDSVQALRRDADTMATWHAQSARRVATWGVVLGVLAGVGIGLSWRAHQIARRTQAVLEQILENQAQAQARQEAVKGAKRR